MQNKSILTEFFLSGLSDLPSLQLPLFLFFLLIYLLTLTWNLLIIVLIVTNSHLHTPMYFFLGNLASLDFCASTVTVPRMLFDLRIRRSVIALAACTTQVFFFILFATSEVLLLAVMSYDRYIAICRPLHYMQIMQWSVCVQLASIVWSLGFTNSLVHTLYALKLTFCETKNIASFFCDLPQLFQISCTDIFINVLLILLLGVILGVGSLTLTFLPYVYIFQTALKMQVEGSRSKVFSTCSSHLSVVFIFFGSIMFNYFSTSASSYYAGDKVVAVFYTSIVPLLNPLIYSLRNQDIRAGFKNALKKIGACRNSPNWPMARNAN
ncbi:olfactory receptor 8B8-like [Gastrophryne carolinensis]